METEKRLIDANAKFIEEHFTNRLIDRYALIDVIENTDWYHISPQGKLVGGANSQHNTPLYKAADIHRALANAPILDAVEVVHGRWEPREDVKGFVRCSVCHDCNIYDEWPDGKKWNYCPNCGADMRERKDND